MIYEYVSIIQASIPESYEIKMLEAGLLTYARFSAFPLYLMYNSGQIRKPFERLQLRDSSGISPYSLLIPDVIPGTKSATNVIIFFIKENVQILNLISLVTCVF